MLHYKDDFSKSIVGYHHRHDIHRERMFKNIDETVFSTRARAVLAVVCVAATTTTTTTMSSEALSRHTQNMLNGIALLYIYIYIYYM